MSISLFFSLSFSLSCILFFVPSFHPHIKPIYHQDQTQCVSQRQADLLVGFFCVCEFYDWGQGPGTQRYISDKVSLWLLAFLALSMPFRAAWPTWIARPHVNATFDLNSWVPGDVTTLTSCCSASVGRDIVEKNIDCLVELPSFGDIAFSQIHGTLHPTAMSPSGNHELVTQDNPPTLLLVGTMFCLYNPTNGSAHQLMDERLAN